MALFNMVGSIVSGSVGFIIKKEKFFVADIKAPITGKIFSLCEMKNDCTKVNWGDDLFIISTVPDDTRD